MFQQRRFHSKLGTDATPTRFSALFSLQAWNGAGTFGKETTLTVLPASLSVAFVPSHGGRRRFWHRNDALSIRRTLVGIEDDPARIRRRGHRRPGRQDPANDFRRGGARSTRQNVESPEKATYYNQDIYSVRRREWEEARHDMKKL